MNHQTSYEKVSHTQSIPPPRPDNFSEPMCNVKFRQFLGFYSIFCLGMTKNEVHICNLHAKTQLLMYDKGGLSTKKFSTPEGRWRTVRKPGLDENSGFEWKNLYLEVFLESDDN